MTSKEFSELKELLTVSKNIVLIPHKNPDGDAIGSALAMYHYLYAKGHRVTVISPNDYPDFLKWLPGSDVVIKWNTQQSQSKKAIGEAALIFLLDFNDLSRVGKTMQDVLQTYTGIFVMIDHHQQPSKTAQYLFFDTEVCATAQMVYHFIENLKDIEAITPEIATCLYTGILTDTGSFQFPTTTPATHRIAAELIERGAHNSKIYDCIFNNNSYERLQLLGHLLKNMQVLEKYRTAYMTLSEEEKEKCHFQKGDTEGVVNYTLSMKNIVLGIIFIEDREQGIIKISFRSKGTFSVNEFARAHFNGGGHINAAGGKMYETMETTLAHFFRCLPLYKEALEKSYEE